MKQYHDEDATITIVVALVVALMALAAFLVPAPPDDVPEIETVETAHFVNIVEASEIEPRMVLIEVVKAENEEPDESEQLADEIIECESSYRNIEIIDTNGKWSRGVAMFQDETWSWMSKEAGVIGTSLEPEKARQVLVWAIREGIAPDHWVTCYKRAISN
jgi:hypothetical protein